MEKEKGLTSDLWSVMSWFLLGLQLNRTTGIYISFFLFTIYALSRRWKSPGIKLLVAASCVMAALGTIQVAVTIAMAVAIVRSVQQVLCGQILDQPEFPLQLAAIQDIAAVINVWVNPDLPWSKVEAHFIPLVLLQIPSS